MTVTTASGEKVTGSISREDDFTVSLYDAAGGFHEWPKDKVRIDVDDKLQPHRALLPKYSNADIHNMTAYLVTLK